MLQKIIDALKDPRVVTALGVGLIAPRILSPMVRSLTKFVKINK